MIRFLLAAPLVTANEIGLPTSTNNLGDVLANILKILMSLAGMLSLVFMIYAGILLSYAQGVAARVQKGRETMLYAVVGLVLSIGGYAIVTFITSLSN